MRPSMDRKWCPKTEKEKTTSSNSSSSTQNASNRITRVINKAVSTILPSSSNKQSLNSTSNNPPPGLSSILSRPSLTVHSNSSSKRATEFSSSSQVSENQTSRLNPNPNPNSRANPVLRTNLLTTTPTFSGVTSTQVTSNPRNKRVTCPAGPVLHNPLPTNGHYDNKGKRVISTRFATNSVNSSQVTNKSDSARQTFTGKSLLNPPYSYFRGSKNPPVKVNPSLAGFSSTKSLSLNNGNKADAISTKSSVKASITDPKGKGIANVGEPSAAKKYPNLRLMESGNPSEKAPFNSNKKSTYKNYEDWIKNHFISSSDRSQLIEPVPVGERCQLCSLDLAFLPLLSSTHSSLDPPVVVVLPCGHCSHEACVDHVFGSLEEPKCFACITSCSNRRI